MPGRLKFASTAPESVRELAKLLGSRLRLARRRRLLTLREAASRAGIAYDTARAAELGSVQTGLGAYLALAWALGLDTQFARLLRPEDDLEGTQLESSRAPRRVRHRKSADDDEF